MAKCDPRHGLLSDVPKPKDGNAAVAPPSRQSELSSSLIGAQLDSNVD